MELDLETFLVALYVIVDDLYQSHIQPRMPACGGPPAQMSDSEVLCLGLAVQWRSGSCTRPLRIIILPPKPGKMSPTQPVLEGARP